MKHRFDGRESRMRVPGGRQGVATSRGVALLVVLIFTLALTGIALLSARLALSGEAMARNQLDMQVARQAAEAALRDAEKDLLLASGTQQANAACARNTDRPVLSQTVLFDDSCTRGQCGYKKERLLVSYATASAPDRLGEVWWPSAKGGLWNDAPQTKPSASNNGSCAAFTGAVPLGVFTGASAIRGVVQQPEYLMEFIRRGDGIFFRITARGFGYRPGTEVVVQSYFLVPEN